MAAPFVARRHMPASRPDGGGLLLIGSYRDDANKDRLGLPAKINIEIKNGGKLENDGQLWFGADDEHSIGTEAKITINGGTMDLTGGTILYNRTARWSVDADLAFFYDFDEGSAVPEERKMGDQLHWSRLDRRR